MDNWHRKVGNPILPFTGGANGWKDLLADPEKHWKTGYSARTLAHSWEAANGFPSEVARAFDETKDQLLHDLKPLLAIPEFKVSLPGGTRRSQNDIFVLARSSSHPVVLMVEGKVEESFGPTLGDWLRDETEGKRERLEYLLRCLGLEKQPSDLTRYQLLHRAASAMIVAEQYRAHAAVLLIHSFSRKRSGFEDYEAFASLFGQSVGVGAVRRLTDNGSIWLLGVWVEGDPAFLEM